MYLFEAMRALVVKKWELCTISVTFVLLILILRVINRLISFQLAFCKTLGIVNYGLTRKVVSIILIFRDKTGTS